MKAAPSNSIWSREFILILLITVCVTSAIAIISPITSVYISESLGATSGQIGAISSVMVLFAIFARPLAGFAVDRWGRKYLLAGSAALLTAGNLLLLLPLGIQGIGINRAITGIPFALVTTAMITLTSDLLAEEHRPIGLSYATILAMLLSFSIGPTIGLQVLARYGHAAVIWLSATFGMLAVLGALQVHAPDIKDPTSRFSLANMLDGKAVWFALVLGLAFSGMAGVVTFSPLFSRAMGFGSEGAFFLLYALGLVGSRLANQAATKHHLLKQSAAAAILTNALGFFLIGVLRTNTSFLMGALVLGFGNGLLSPILFAMALNLVAPERRGACNAVLMFAQDSGFVAGSYAFGWAAQALGSYAAPYTAAAGMMLFPLGVLILLALPDYNRQLKRREAHQAASNKNL